MLLVESDWFLAISKFRGLLENAYRGTVFGGPDGTVAPLPDALGGDPAKWPVLKATVGLYSAFFTLLRSKAHFLMLPETIVATLKDSGRVYVSETIPAETPLDASGAEVANSELGTVELRIPTASQRLAEAGYVFGRRVVGLPEENYQVLVTLYHEMVHALFSLVVIKRLDDAELGHFIFTGAKAYENAVDLNSNPVHPYAAFKEAVGYYVSDKIGCWLSALSDLNVLLQVKLPKGDLLNLKLHDIAEKYDARVEVYGVVGNRIIMSPALPDELRGVIDAKVLDSLPLTRRFDDTPLARLRASLLG